MSPATSYSRTHNPVVRLIAAAALACLLAACSSGDAPAPTPMPPPAPTPPPPPPASVERLINPALTNASLTENLSPHFVINPDPAALPAQRLFVMLPGSGATPQTYEDVVRRGAQRGYHALGLTYPNDRAVGSLCGSGGDPDCAGAVRREVITGEASSPLVSVDAANSIDGRLLSLLTYLEANFPTEGWGRFLVNGAVDWSLITVAGHSQGGGHAAFMAKLRDLNRVVMFSGTGDTGGSPGTSPSWVDLPNVTAAARQYGFTHVDDDLALLSAVLRNWDRIGLDDFGAPVSVDTVPPPFENSRQLTTAAAPNPNPTGPSASPTHGAPAVDAVTPRDAQGNPIFEPVWDYLAFP